MERLRISAVIALVIYFLSTSLIITECRGLGAEEQSRDDDGGIPHAYLNSSLAAAATSSSAAQMPPIDLLMQMSCATDMEEFLNFIDMSSIDPKVNIVNRGVERSSALTPKPAACKPEPTVVPLLPDNNSLTTLYYPSCTRVNRCGGCCAHSLLSCQPVATETLTFQVLKSEWNGVKYQLRNKELIAVEQHTKCSCECAVREFHCNDQQKYIPEKCQCKCDNVDEQQKCEKTPDTRLWDSSTCQCVCRKATDCTTGSYFNPNTCECVKIPIYNGNGQASSTGSVTNAQSPEDRKKFIIKAIPLPSADTTRYSTTN